MLSTVLLAAMLLLLWLGARALGSVTRRQRMALLALRAAIFASLAVAILDPQWVRSSLLARPPLIAVLVDTSRSMTIADTPESSARIQQARRLVDAARGSLRTKARLLLWRFDADARSAQGDSALQADGVQTDIGGALRALSRHVAPERLSAVWLLSDGRDTTGSEDSAINAAALPRVPVNAVGLGSDAQPRDVELWSVLAPKSVRAGEKALAVATVRAPGFAGRQIEVTLRGSDGGSQKTTSTVGQGGTATASFTISAQRPGMESYSVSVARLAGELTDLNNSRVFVVSVARGDRKVLLIDRPRPELKFLRRALSELAGVKTDIYLQKATDGGFWLEGNPPRRAPLPSGSALRQYDAVVIGDVPAKALPASFLGAAAAFVTERGGGLALLGGQESFGMGGYAETPIADVLPLQLGGTLDGYLPSALRVRLGPRAEEHPVLPAAESALEWSRLPVLEGANLTKAPKPAADVLLEAATTTGRRVPIVAAQRVGAGRSLCVTSDTTYRWVFSEYATDASARIHAALWQRAIRWLSTRANDRPVSIALDKAACTVGEPVRVIATVLDEGFASVPDAEVTATVTGPGGRKATVQCYPTGDAGRYEGTYRPALTGKHTVRVAAKRGAKQLGSDAEEFVAHTELAELRDVRLNRVLLERIAEVSGGKYYEAEGVERAMAEPPATERAAVHRRVSVARSWPFFILVLMLCGLDWGLRRRWNLA